MKLRGMSKFKWNGNFITERKGTLYLITTPIFYVNALPHIGHLYSAVIADAVSRFRALLGYSVAFSTGTDEHGTKIQEAAARGGVALPQYCHDISKQYKHLFNQCSIGYTDFVRTTESRHTETVQKFWMKLKARGHIYEGSYSGWYCIPDESFLSNNQLVERTGPDGKTHKFSAESGHPVEWMCEKNFLFRLSSFRNDLLHWLRDERSVRPPKFRQMLLDFVSNEELVQDLSVSRPKERVHWAVPVPDAPDQTVYVWLDALASYLTVAPKWPPDVQVIGKDILKFHGVYWPAFLIAAGLEPPRSLFCHSHWLVEGEKMSKSKGNVVDPYEAMRTYTSSGVRYFLLREGVAHSDGNYNGTKVIRVLNSELADTLGNLLNRCCGSTVNPQQVFPKFCPEYHPVSTEAVKLMHSLEQLPDAVGQHYEDANFYRGIDAIMATLHEGNRFFEVSRPWELRKREERANELKGVVHLAMETLRVCGILLQPVVPDLCDTLLDKLGVHRHHRLWHHVRPLSWEGASDNSSDSILSRETVVLYRRIHLTK